MKKRRSKKINIPNHNLQNEEKTEEKVASVRFPQRSLFPRSPTDNNNTLTLDSYSSSTDFFSFPTTVTTPPSPIVSSPSIFTNHRQLYQQVNIILSVFLIVLSTLGIICSLFVIGCWIHRKIKRKEQKAEYEKILRDEERNDNQELLLHNNSTNNRQTPLSNFATALFLYQQKYPLSNLVIPSGCILIYSSCIMLILSSLDCNYCKLLTIWCLTTGFNLVYGKLVYDSFLLRDFLRNRQFRIKTQNSLTQLYSSRNSRYNTITKNNSQTIPRINSRKIETSFKSIPEEREQQKSTPNHHQVIDYGMANLANSPFRSLVTSPVAKVVKRPASSSSSIAPQATSSGDESDDTAIKNLNSFMMPKGSTPNRLQTDIFC